MTTFQDVGEFGFIDHISGHVAPEWVLCGIGDDCAVMALDDRRVRLVTTDLMVEGVHFLIDTPPEGLGHKLLAVSLSDVAAMGGMPTDAVVSVAAPGDLDAGYVERVYHGLYACADRFGVAIVGGDTTRSPQALMLNLALTGEMPRDQVCYRSGAGPGDCIYVSGTLGDAAVGLRVTQTAAMSDGRDGAYFLRRLYRPEPRIALGQKLAASGAVTAMIDVSDGVASDVKHICQRSGVSAIIREDAIPMSAAFCAFCTATGRRAADLALSGGEDYELLFAVDAEKTDVIEALIAQEGVPAIQMIGEIVAGDGEVFLSNAEGKRVLMKVAGFEHFK